MSKICMIVHQQYVRDGRVRRYAEALVSAGAKVDALCVSDSEEGAGTASERQAACAVDGVRVFAIPLRHGDKHRGGYMLECALALFLYTVRLLLLHLRNRYDLIHVHNMPDFLVLAALMPKLMGAKVVLDIHDPMPEFYQSKYGASETSVMVRILQLQERFCARLATAIIAANANFRANLIERGVPAQKITVVNNVADRSIFSRIDDAQQEKPGRETFTLIYPGTIAPRYRLDVAIRALPLLIPKIPQIRLLFIGPTVEHTQELAALATELGVEQYVEFHPLMPIHAIPQQMAQADVGIYTAQPDPHMSIATPTKVLEYAAMGLPIVSSRLPIVEAIFDDEDIMFFEPGSVEEFARCIEALYENPVLRQELVRNVDQHYLRNNSWQQEQERYFALLNDLLAERRGAMLPVPRH